MNSGFQWDDGLEGAALDIASIDHTPIRVLAGPGTGKTFSLMRRVARLLQEDEDPAKILVCTFTRTAAHDLTNSLLELGISGAEIVWAGTLHSYCFGLLSKSEVLTQTGRVPRPLLSFEEKFLINDLSCSNFGNKRGCEKLLRDFNSAWARLQTDEPGWPSTRVDREFNQELNNWLLFHNSLLIGEVIPIALNYLRENPAAPEIISFDHILIDEYQDLNKAEQSLLDIFARTGNLCIIGDEDQAIYAFKNAHPEGIATFEQTHPDTLDKNLDVCRRCPRSVVDLANSLIQNNRSRSRRILNPMSDCPEGDIKILQWNTMDDEAIGIAEIINDRIENDNVPAGKILVLAPRRQFGYAIRDSLNNIAVPAHSFFHEEALEGNPTKIDESKAQQAFTILTLLANHYDYVALRCWCGFGSGTLRKGGWKRINDYCQEKNLSLSEVLEKSINGIISIPYTNDIIERYNELTSLLETMRELRGEELVDCLFPIQEEWSYPFRTLVAQIEEDDFDAVVLREKLRIGITQPELPTDVDYVRVMSLHKSKGLTADMVVVVGCIEGLIPGIYNPNNTSLNRNQFTEEQRRLFYVAITRTKRILILSSVLWLPRDLAHRMGAIVYSGNITDARTQASDFLRELGPNRPRTVLGNTLIR